MYVFFMGGLFLPIEFAINGQFLDVSVSDSSGGSSPLLN